MGIRPSILKQVVTRLQEALREGDLAHGPDTYLVRGYDIRVLFETIKRFGGRADWTPTPQNIEQLPGPVRHHIYAREAEITRLHYEAINALNLVDKATKALREERHPRR